MVRDHHPFHNFENYNLQTKCVRKKLRGNHYHGIFRIVVGVGAVGLPQTRRGRFEMNQYTRETNLKVVMTALRKQIPQARLILPILFVKKLLQSKELYMLYFFSFFYHRLYLLFITQYCSLSLSLSLSLCFFFFSLALPPLLLAMILY